MVKLNGSSQSTNFNRIQDGAWLKGNSVIAINGDEKVDLENTQLYQKDSRSSLT